jgi:benzoate/toluate 1,2-dioxygenase beta subunit
VRESVEAFVYREARLLDERRFREWEHLWTDRALYWVPAEHDDYDPGERVSLIYDDRATLAKRVERLTGPDSHSEQPAPHTRRIVSNIEIEDGDGPEVVVASNFMALCYRRDRQETWGGRTTHHLVPEGDSFLISYKKVMLVNCSAFLTHLPFLP